MTPTPLPLTQGGPPPFEQFNDSYGNKLIALNRDGTVFAQGFRFPNFSTVLRAVQTSRVSSTIAPGLSTVDLLWGQPFADNTYFVLFPNPPFAPGAIAPIPPPNTQTDAWTSTINADFTAQFGEFTISSGKLDGSSIDSGNNRTSMGWVQAGNWAANQYAQIKITATTSSVGGLGPAVYVADGSFYGFYIDSGVAYLFLQAGDITTVLNTVAATLSLNDVLYLSISGQTLVAQQNGTTILTAFVPVPLPVGNPGVQGFQSTTLRANNFQAGNLQVPVVAVTPVVLGPWVYLPNGTGIEMTLQNLNLTPLETQIDAVGIAAS